jgi:ribose transport system ATP-binding protein
LSVAENLLLDRLPNRAGWIDRADLHAQAARQLAKIGMQNIDPATPVARLGIGQQQMVEIARNLQDDTRVLVLDEPTAMLTPRETTHLFEQIDLLKARGVAIVYVSHRLEELQRIADRVAVLRDGRLVDVRAMAGVREEELVQRMVGRAVHDNEGRARRVAGPVVLTHAASAAARSCAMSTWSCARAKSWAWPAWSARAARSWCACCLAPTARTAARSRCMKTAT